MIGFLYYMQPILLYLITFFYSVFVNELNLCKMPCSAILQNLTFHQTNKLWWDIFIHYICISHNSTNHSVTTKFFVTAVTTKLVVLAYFLESCDRVSQWVSDQPDSREATTSKNRLHTEELSDNVTYWAARRGKNLLWKTAVNET